MKPLVPSGNPSGGMGGVCLRLCLTSLLLAVCLFFALAGCAMLTENPIGWLTPIALTLCTLPPFAASLFCLRRGQTHLWLTALLAGAVLSLLLLVCALIRGRFGTETPNATHFGAFCPIPAALCGALLRACGKKKKVRRRGRR